MKRRKGGKRSYDVRKDKGVNKDQKNERNKRMKGKELMRKEEGGKNKKGQKCCSILQRKKNETYDEVTVKFAAWMLNNINQALLKKRVKL